jgi:phenylacetate-CoA ligase
MSSEPKHRKLRKNVSIEPRWTTTLAGMECRYILRDGSTDWYTWATEQEAVFAMSLRYLQEPTDDRIQRYASNRHGLRFEKSTIDTLFGVFERYGFLEEMRSKDEIRIVQQAERRRIYDGKQLDALRSVIGWLSTESPYYSAAFREYCGGDVPEMTSMDDLRKLPRLSKAKFRSEMANIHPRALAGNRDAFPTSWATSSGTSGNRVQTLTDPQRQKRFVSDCTWQFVADSLPTAQTTKSCVLTTPVCSGTECHMDINRPLEERLISDGRRLILNSFISPAVAPKRALEQIAAEISEFQPNVLRGAGSYLAAYARYLQRNGLTPPKLDFIVLGWELNSRIHARLLEKVFGCRVIDEWGATEMMPISSQCRFGNFHVADEHYIEIVREGKPVRPGQVGQILVTSLRRHATPLIRYEIGDLARPAAGPCRCGDPSQIFASIEGRARDCVFSVSGEPITPREVDNVISGETPREGIEYYSLVQQGPRTYKLIYVASDQCPDSLESELRGELLELLGGLSAELRFERTKEIYPSNSGKFRLAYHEDADVKYDW